MLERYDGITNLKCFRYAVVSRSAGGSNLEGGEEGSSRQAGSGHVANSDSIFGRPAVVTRLANFLMDVQVGSCSTFSLLFVRDGKVL